MGKLTPEQQKALEELTNLANAPDDDEDFEIEIYDGTKGARVPYSRGKSWLKDTFGFDIGDAPTEPKKEPKTQTKKDPDPADQDQGALRHFRQRNAS